LGNGSTADSAAPVDVSGLNGGVIAIAAGDDHTCAITNSGGVKCWGYNDSGQLGEGTTTDSSVPVDVVGLSGGARSIAAGWGHTCALTVRDGILCWGSNKYGQLGDGTAKETRGSIGAVAGLSSGVEALSASGGQSCALTTGGGVKCWGSNKYGQLGDGTAENRNMPVDVSRLGRGVEIVAVGWNHACAATGGGVKCWGWNYFGQLGDGTNTTRSTEAAVSGLAGVTALAAGGAHTCAIVGGASIRCWGNNDYGQLGDGTLFDSNVPVEVVGLP
jgi:alpha-tubulin suppressor-like RCC1 family protein